MRDQEELKVPLLAFAYQRYEASHSQFVVPDAFTGIELVGHCVVYLPIKGDKYEYDGD